MLTISEHTFDEKLIDPNGWVLDLGCINFSFAKGVSEYCKNIICVDPNPNIKEVPDGIIYERCAVTHLEGISSQVLYIYNDINGYSLLNPPRDWCVLENVMSVPVCTIKSIMDKYQIEQFELIKFDIEGSEYKILENMDWSISKQFSIEFHDFRFMNPYYPNNQVYYDNLLSKISNVCVPVIHELTDHPGFPHGMGRNYWDSLFIKKEYIK